MELLTTAEAAAKLGTTPGNLRVIALRREIRPAKMVGRVSLWHPDQLTSLQPGPPGWKKGRPRKPAPAKSAKPARKKGATRPKRKK